MMAFLRACRATAPAVQALAWRSVSSAAAMAPTAMAPVGGLATTATRPSLLASRHASIVLGARLSSVQRKRKKMMNKHKHRKRLKKKRMKNK